MPELAPQRDCDGCTLCCKVMNVPELEKPAGTWCRHCAVGTGCGIHAARPEVCRQFYCMYITNRNLGPDWKPSDAKFVVSHDAGGQRISVYVDIQRPESWRREPYLSTFRAWAEIGARTGGQVVVFVARHAFVVVPDRIVDLGEVAQDDLILTAVTKTAQGIRLEPFKASKDDPRAKRFLAAKSAR
jgi:hypothetical protein